MFSKCSDFVKGNAANIIGLRFQNAFAHTNRADFTEWNSWHIIPKRQQFIPIMLILLAAGGEFRGEFREVVQNADDLLLDRQRREGDTIFKDKRFAYVVLRPCTIFETVFLERLIHNQMFQKAVVNFGCIA